MPYIFTPAAPDSPVARFADMKEFRQAMSPLMLTIKGSKVTLDGAAFGTLSYTKKGPDRTGAPTVEDVLASIDDLEQEEDEQQPVPVRLEGTPQEDIDAIVDWQMNRGRREGELPITVRPPTANVPARRRATTSRMSHKNCGHPTTGQAGKEARAACRARHRLLPGAVA